MTCDELELLLPEGLTEPRVQAHLAGCARCQQTAAVLALAVQPAASVMEKAKLGGLPGAVQAQWGRQQARRAAARTFVGLAVAASLGAVVASGVMWKLNGAQPVQVRGEPEVLVLMEDSTPASDEELSFEVSWPSLNEEGDVL